MATSTYERILDEVRQLPTDEQRRLIGELALELATTKRETRSTPRESLYGIAAHLGPAPSAEEIDEVRREAWATFPRDDI